MSNCSKSAWPPRVVTVRGLHGSEGAHWQSWLERQFARTLRVEQDDWEAPQLARWANAVRDTLARERGPFVLAVMPGEPRERVVIDGLAREGRDDRQPDTGKIDGHAKPRSGTW